MKKLTKVIAGVMALTMAAGLAVMAAPSSTTTNTTVTETEAAAPAVDYVVYRDSTTTVTRAAAVATNGDVVRVASDYTDTDPSVLATAIAPDKAVSDAILGYVAAVAPGKTVIGPIKVQVYQKGTALTTGFGTFKAIIGVGARYNGQTVTAYVYHQDGTVETIVLTVEAGKVVVPLTAVGTIVLAF